MFCLNGVFLVNRSVSWVLRAFPGQGAFFCCQEMLSNCQRFLGDIKCFLDTREHFLGAGKNLMDARESFIDARDDFSACLRLISM